MWLEVAEKLTGSDGIKRLSRSHSTMLLGRRRVDQETRQNCASQSGDSPVQSRQARGMVLQVQSSKATPIRYPKSNP